MQMNNVYNDPDESAVRAIRSRYPGELRRQYGDSPEKDLHIIDPNNRR